jgi:hypothetical protein
MLEPVIPFNYKTQMTVLVGLLVKRDKRAVGLIAPPFHCYRFPKDRGYSMRTLGDGLRLEKSLLRLNR